MIKRGNYVSPFGILFLWGIQLFFAKKVEIKLSIRLCGNRECGVLFCVKSPDSVLFDDESGVVRGFPMPVPGWGLWEGLVFALVIVERDPIWQ